MTAALADRFLPPEVRRDRPTLFAGRPGTGKTVGAVELIRRINPATIAVVTDGKPAALKGYAALAGRLDWEATAQELPRVLECAADNASAGRLAPADRLISLPEIAARLGVAEARVQQLARFPAPVAQCGAHAWWDEDGIQRWADDHHATLAPADDAPLVVLLEELPRLLGALPPQQRAEVEESLAFLLRVAASGGVVLIATTSQLHDRDDVVSPTRDLVGLPGWQVISTNWPVTGPRLLA